MTDLSLMTKWEMGKLFDYAVLPKDTAAAEIRTACRTAVEYNCRAVCLSSAYWVSLTARELEGAGVLVNAAVAFPFGQQTCAVKVHETLEAVRLGAVDLDCCMNVGAFKDKRYIETLHEFREFKKAAGNASTKMIIETCMLTRDEIAAACKLVAEAGIDWVKSSTGQYAGPSAQDVRLMADSVKGSGTRVKVSGVKEPRPQNAFAFIIAGAELIGTQKAPEILDAVDSLREIGLVPPYSKT